MARTFIRGDGGRFAGSKGGGGGGGRGGKGGKGAGSGGLKPVRVRAGAVPTGKYTGGRRRISGAKVYTRPETGRIGGQQVGARRYVSSRRGSTRDALVFKVGKNGRPTRTPPRDSMMTRAAVGKGTRLRPGSPIRGNRNVRYVSPITAASRTGPGYAVLGGPLATARLAGRAHSAATLRVAARGGRNPQTGYVVMYGARAPGRGG